MQTDERRRVQLAVRIGGLAFVVAWLFSPSLQARVPYWLPFLILAFTELEFVARGWWETRTDLHEETPQSALERRLPGRSDADLGWVEVTDEDGETVLVPAPARAARRRSPWRAVAGIAVGIALFAATVAVDRSDSWASLSAGERARAETRFSHEAGVIADRKVQIECDESYAFTGVGSDAAGVAFPRRALAYLQPDVCHSLYRIAFGSRLGAREPAAWALTVLAHEAVHLRGERSEAVTECYALQEGVALGRRLGLSTADATALMRSQLARDLADRSIDRVPYRLPSECKDGGELDLRPDDPSFP